MSNLCIIIGSPRRKTSNSEYLATELLSFFNNDIDSKTYYVSDIVKNHDLFEEIIKYDNILISSSLYADSFPSTMLDFLWQFGEFLSTKESLNINLYGIVNSGFIEGTQNRLALEILRNFAASNNLFWKLGIGMGSGEMLRSIKSIPWDKGPKKPVYEALIKLKDTIENNKINTSPFILVSLKFPKRLFMFVANHGWKVQAKKEFNLSSKDLYREIY